MRDRRTRAPRAASTALALVPLFTTAPALSARDCPDPDNPKTCGYYEIFAPFDGWIRQPDGTVRIEFWVNPAQPWMPAARAVGAVRAAFRTWELWNPNVHMIYKGTTPRLAIPGDGYTVAAWLGEGIPLGGGSVALHPSPDRRRFDEADIVLNPTGWWQWRQCQQRDGSCRKKDPDHWEPADVQAVVTHEIGHMLGLGDLGQEAASLTMSQYGGTEGPQATLGLGDVLGVKALYPWRCPRPDRRGRYPARYRELCPRIRIYAP